MYLVVEDQLKIRKIFGVRFQERLRAERESLEESGGGDADKSHHSPQVSPLPPAAAPARVSTAILTI